MDKAKMYPIMQFKDAETEIDTEILKDLYGISQMMKLTQMVILCHLD